MSMLKLLQQSERWVTRDGRELALEEMTPSHRRNLQWWLRANATRLYQRDCWEASLSMALHYGDDMPDGVYSSFSHIEHQALDPDVDEARAWMDQTPFMRRLCEFVADDLVART